MGDGGEKQAAAAEGWRLSVNDFQLPERPKDPHFVKRVIKRCHGTLLFMPPIDLFFNSSIANSLICLLNFSFCDV